MQKHLGMVLGDKLDFKSYIRKATGAGMRISIKCILDFMLVIVMFIKI